MKNFCNECGEEYEIILWENFESDNFVIICSHCNSRIEMGKNISRIINEFINKEKWDKEKIKRLENEISILRDKTKINYSVFREL